MTPRGSSRPVLSTGSKQGNREIDRDVGVLIVDDNAANLLTYEAILEELQVNLVKAHSGQEALRYAFKDDFAAIMMDIQMPEMDGFETATLLRRRKSSRETPLLFITAAFPGHPHIFQGYSLGAVGSTREVPLETRRPVIESRRGAVATGNSSSATRRGRGDWKDVGE